MVSQSVVVFLAFLAAVSATDVHPCRSNGSGKSAKSKEDLKNSVELNPCNNLPCKLRKGTNQGITIKFTPVRDTTGHLGTVQIGSCGETPCMLKRGSKENVTIEFTPETDVEDVTNSVIGEFYGTPFPFIGLDGASICNKIFTESGDKVACPLTAGITYHYKDYFPIPSSYPIINLRIHWSLQSKNAENIVCFVVPAKITA